MEVSSQLRPPGERVAGHWIGGWMNPRDSLEAVAKRKKTATAGGNRTPLLQHVGWSLYCRSYSVNQLFQ